MYPEVVTVCDGVLEHSKAALPEFKTHRRACRGSGPRMGWAISSRQKVCARTRRTMRSDADSSSGSWRILFVEAFQRAIRKCA